MSGPRRFRCCIFRKLQLKGKVVRLAFDDRLYQSAFSGLGIFSGSTSFMTLLMLPEAAAPII